MKKTETIKAETTETTDTDTLWYSHCGKCDWKSDV